MNHVSCSCCNQVVVPSPPDRGYWALIGAFWVFSLLFGIDAAAGGGLGFALVISWVLIATTSGVLAHHATAWTCPECAAALTPPDDVIAFTRAMKKEEQKQHVLAHA